MNEVELRTARAMTGPDSLPGGGACIGLALVGSGGDGVALIGDLMMQMAARQGLFGMMVQAYGPQIRGGESAAILRLSETETVYEGDHADILVCFRTSDLARFRGTVRLHERSTIVLDQADPGRLPDWLGRDIAEVLRFPFSRVVEGVEVPGEPRNMLAMGLVCRALGWSAEVAHAALSQRFGHRPTVLSQNLAAFDRAYATGALPELPVLTPRASGLTVESGNEACARGAMAAGLRFFAGYPITPSSEVMETLIEELPERGGRVIQAEDEIAALGMVVGASFGGVPSMTATSGPGLSLMTEMLGLASMAELPVVVIDAQRAGPATGMPSRTEQRDLFHAIYGGHGDFPRVVLAAFDVVHARDLMHRAFAISEEHQLPVIVLTDAYIAQRRQIRTTPDDLPPPRRRRVWGEGDTMLRFALNHEHGATPFRVPGTPGGTYLAAGIEHTPQGSPTSDGTMHQRMSEKRFEKLETIALETSACFRMLGVPDAPRLLVGWGSTFGVLREFVAQHPEFRAFLPEVIHPFPRESFEEWRAGTHGGAVVELSYQGQLHQHMSSVCDMTRWTRACRSGGLPLSVAELAVMLEVSPC